MKTKYHYNNNFSVNPIILNDLLLYQIGEMMCDVGTIVLPHIHLDWYEFTFCISGSGSIYTNNVEEKIKANDLYFSHPKETHKIVSNDTDPLRYFFCAFNFTESSPLKPLLEECRKITVNEKNRKFHNSNLSSYFQALLSEVNYDSAISRLTFEYEFKTFVLKGINMFKTENIKFYKTPKINNLQLLSFNIINYIDNNLTSLDNVTYLSEVFGYNYSYLSRCFRKTTGETISDYFQNKKLNLAKQKIEQDDLSITEIATTLNYSSIYVFSRAFKEKFKINPTQYRIDHVQIKDN